MIYLTSAVYEQIEATIGRSTPERGGILGAKDVLTENVLITHYYYDYNVAHSSVAYTPNVTDINRVLSESWLPQSVYMVGIIHSHVNGVAAPSCGDIAYCEKILRALDTVDQFYLPIAIFENGLMIIHNYVVRLIQGGRVICKKDGLSVRSDA